MVGEVNLEFAYAVADAPVFLTVVIGDGQIGGSAVKLGDTLIGKPGAIKNRRIGNGPDLLERELSIKTLVSDINDLTNWTSVTYKLTGGPPQTPVTARFRVANNGDGVLYRTTFRFEDARIEA